MLRLGFALLMMIGLALGVAGHAAPQGPALILDIKGPVGPATADYVGRGLETVADRNAPVVILRIDTPGGLDSAMRDIVKAILASPVPVVGYVAPSGARAASAGTFILYATHVAAMAPGTDLGAATPIQIGGPGNRSPLPSRPSPAKPDAEPQSPAPATQQHPTVQDKTVNEAIAYIRSLAEMRGRNADWAEKAVREAASLPAREALQAGVVDLIAATVPDLLVAVDNRRVSVAGVERPLKTAGLTAETLAPDWRNELLSILTNPNVAYILMIIGIYGIILEFYNPGMVLPGTVGAISLLLALYAFNVLPVNYVGLALILLGIALMVSETFVPSFGALGIGGIAAFVVGSVMLMDTDAPGFQIYLPLVVSFAAASAGLFLFVIVMLMRSRQKAVVSGPEEMIGSGGEVLSWSGGEGRVRTHGEVWRARSANTLSPGAQVRVRARDGLTLVVEPEE